MMAMGCPELGSATSASRVGFPVSKTQTVVGSLIGVGFASRKSVNWARDPVIVSRMAGMARWLAAILLVTSKYAVLERKSAVKLAIRPITFLSRFHTSHACHLRGDWDSDDTFS